MQTLKRYRLTSAAWLFLAGLAITLITGYGTANAQEPLGRITVYGNEAPGECGYDMRNSQLEYQWLDKPNKHTLCAGIISHFALTGAPSAVTITFIARTSRHHPSCVWNGDETLYWMKLKTRSNITTTGHIDINEIFASAVKDKMVAPSLQITDFWKRSDVGPGYNFAGNMSCITIERSD